MAVGIIMWGRFFQQDGGNTVKVTVPAPSTNPGFPWLWDFIHDHAQEVAASFDYVQLPPWSLAQGGNGAGCDGYGVFQLRNLNGTRYGSLESLMSAVAALNSHGTKVLGDLVLHQMSGENGGPGVFTYPGANGVKGQGRGCTTPGWFRGGMREDDPIPPFSPADPVPNLADDYPFGRERVYVNCMPMGSSLRDSEDYLTWVSKRTGVTAYRIDDTKGTNQGAVRSIINSLPGAFFYSEYDDGNPYNIDWWTKTAPISGASAAEDFTLHYALMRACNGFDATQLLNQFGYWQINSGLSVGFVDNPDTDTSPGQQVIFNKGIAYALMLNLPLRLALVYGKDYYDSSVWPGAYGLRPLIDNLAWISRTFAYGAYQQRWVDKDVFAYTRDGNGGDSGWSGGLLVAVNFNCLSPRTITVQTDWSQGTWLHDYSGHWQEDLCVEARGLLTLTIPSNYYSNGQSYVCFAPSGVDQAYTNTPFKTTQVFYGDNTLDVLELSNGVQELPQRLYAAKSSSLSLHLEVPKAGLHKTTTVKLEVLSNSGNPLREVDMTGEGIADITMVVPQTDWYAIRLITAQLPEPSTFTITATYTGAA